MVCALIAVDTKSLAAAEDASVQAFLSDIAKQAEAAEKREQTAIAGRDGWMYFVPELRALSVGPFWGEDAAKVSRSSKPENADPLPAILDFHRQLKGAGIELLLVPVPAKAAIYPEGLSSAAKASSKLPRLDPAERDFYKLLEREGVGVIDLTPLFLQHRESSTRPLFCRTDTHWSGAGISVAAKAITDRVSDREWFKSAERKELAFKVRDVEITGDLARMLDENNPAYETVKVKFAGRKQGDEIVPFEPSRESPVLLIGDSHTLVFHDPTLFARGGGLPDELAVRFGFPVDLIGVRGSGANSPRIDLLRRGDNLKGKKLVIWCFSFREFTESTSGWRKIPVIK
jgi:alginate O-acetyltransferase complex protein AlgJ